MPFGLGFFATTGAGAAAGAYELIQTQLISSSTSSLTFSSIPSTYKHLQIRATIRTDRAGNQDDLMMVRLNGDTGSNYAAHAMYNGSSQVQTLSQTSQTYWRALYVNGSGAATNAFAGLIMDILDYGVTTKNTTMRALNGGHEYNWIALASGVWMNTAAVTSITFNMPLTSANFVSGTRFSLYGIRG